MTEKGFECPTELTVDIPLSLRYLIEANDKLLKIYQQRLQAEVLNASDDMMKILKMSIHDGWKLDMERMVYTRPYIEELNENE